MAKAQKVKSKKQLEDQMKSFQKIIQDSAPAASSTISPKEVALTRQQLRETVVKSNTIKSDTKRAEAELQDAQKRVSFAGRNKSPVKTRIVQAEEIRFTKRVVKAFKAKSKKQDVPL
jgi:hypothetical protein